jgi:hypothetical protein
MEFERGMWLQLPCRVLLGAFIKSKLRGLGL